MSATTATRSPAGTTLAPSPAGRTLTALSAGCNCVQSRPAVPAGAALAAHSAVTSKASSPHDGPCAAESRGAAGTACATLTTGYAGSVHTT